jgi:modulator of FtsH protease HflK
MPWSNQSGGNGGGPWGQGGGGQGGGGGGPQGPWGGGNGPRPGNTPPDLEEILRRSQDRLKDMLPGGSMGGKGTLLLVLLAVLLWAATGFYTVRPNEVGINMVFGKFIGKSSEGLRYNFPYPVGHVIKPSVTTINRTEVGYRSSGGPQGRARDVVEESMMLTGDENIIDIDFDVQWQINPAKAEDFIFNIQNPEGSIKAVAESAMREVIGRRNIQAVLTTEQSSVAQEVRQIMQNNLDAYGAGVLVTVVQLQSASPPAQVRESFFDVNAAQQDLVRLQNEAETYVSRIVPEARGQAAQMLQQAEGYRDRIIAEARGQSSRFTQVYDEYKKSPDVTRERMFLETMEKLLAGADKVILDQGKDGQGVVPYLPLNELPRRGSAAPTQGTNR